MNRTKFGERTINGLNRADFDEVNIAGNIDSLTIDDNEGSAGQVLCKNPITNKLEFNAVPIADNTITTNMIQDLQITNDKIANNTIQNGKIADTTIEGGKIANDTIDGTKLTSNININTTGSLSIGGITTLKNIVLFYDGTTAKATYSPLTDVLNISNIILTNSFQLGSTLQADIPSNSITLGGDTIFGGELSMSVGGAEVFNMNSHNLTNGGTATFDTLNLGTALNMLNLNLDLGSGDITANDIGCNDITCNNILGTNFSFNNGNLYIELSGTAVITLNQATGGITCENLIINNHTGTLNLNNIDANNIDCVHLDTDRVKTDLIQLPRTSATTMQISPTGIETNGGYLDTNGGNLSMLNGDIIGANDIECVNLDAGTIEGPTNLNGVLNVGYGSIDSSTNNGQITGYGGSLSIRLDNGAGVFSSLECDQFTSNGGALTNVGVINNDTTHSQIFASRLYLSDTSGGLVPTSSVVYPTTIPIKQFDIYSSLNDIPRILACKSFFADHNYSRTISTTYSNIDKDTTTLNVAFNVPPSCKILVEVGFYVGTTLANERLMLKLVNSVGTEFYTAYINDSNHGHSTENMECQFASIYGTRGQTIITKFFLSFPTSKRGNLVNLQPQAATNTGSCSITTGGSSSGQSPPMYVKVESLGSTSAYNWHYETAGGGDDY